MADFLIALWESVFTPGPTPTLLVATNATFGALQVLLAILLFFTHSVHFVVLSFLCGGLWYSINWFAREIQAAKAEADRKEAEGGRNSDPTKRRSPEPGSDTETEKGVESSIPLPPSSSQLPQSAVGVRKSPPVIRKDSSTAASSSSTASGQLLAPKAATDSAVLRRRGSLGDSSGDISTDSEWEKVSEGEGKNK